MGMSHRMRTTRSLPLRMWVSGQLQNPVGLELMGAAIENYGVEGITDTDSEDDSDSRPILSSLSVSLSDACEIAVARQLPSTFLTETCGVEDYLKSVKIIKDHAVAVQGNTT